MAKNKTLQDIYPMVENLPTADQVTLIGFIEKILKDKAKDAENELELIKGSVNSQ